MPFQMRRAARSRGPAISAQLETETRRQILAHAAKIVPARASQIEVRFRGAYCYIDAREPDSPEPMHLCRLRYVGAGQWGLDFYTYSHEKYERAVFMTGSFTGTPEEGLEIGATYLM